MSFFFRHTRCLASTQASCFALHRGQLADRLSALMQSQELCLVVDLRSAGSDKDQAVRAHPRSRCIAHSPNQSLQAKDNVDIFTDCVSDAFEVASEQVTAQLTGPVVSELDLTSSLAAESVCEQYMSPSRVSSLNPVQKDHVPTMLVLCHWDWSHAGTFFHPVTKLKLNKS